MLGHQQLHWRLDLFFVKLHHYHAASIKLQTLQERVRNLYPGYLAMLSELRDQCMVCTLVRKTNESKVISRINNSKM